MLFLLYAFDGQDQQDDGDGVCDGVCFVAYVNRFILLISGSNVVVLVLIALTTTAWLTIKGSNSTPLNPTCIDAVDASPSSGGGSYLTNAFALSSNGFQFSLNLSVASTKKPTQ